MKKGRIRSTSHELNVQFGNLSSIHALFSLKPPSKRSVVIHFVPTVFFSKWPFIYATISLLCDFHFLFPPLESQFIALPCDFFFFFSPYLNYGTVSLEDNFYKIIMVPFFVLFFYCGESPVLVFNRQVISIPVRLCNECIYCLFFTQKTYRWLSILMPIRSIRRLVLKLNPHHTRPAYDYRYKSILFPLLRLSLIYDHKC